MVYQDSYDREVRRAGLVLRRFPAFNISVDGRSLPTSASVPAILFNSILEMKKRLVRDTLGFGFDVLVRRGHVYRVQLELESTAECGSVCALAVARFSSVSEQVLPPRLIDPELWSAALGLDAIRLPISSRSATDDSNHSSDEVEKTV